MIEIHRLYKKYDINDRRTIIAVIDGEMTIPDNSFVVIRGESGSGKSTLLNLFGGLIRPTEGDIIVNGKNLRMLNENELADFRNYEIGFVFQNYNLIPHLTAKDNIIFSLLFKKWKKSRAKARALELLEKFGILERAHSRSSVMSGGEQQRVAIARAIAHDPSVILADEPTGNLDSRNAEEVLEIFKKLHCEQKKTIIMVSHSSNASRYATLRFVLKDGKLSKESI